MDAMRTCWPSSGELGAFGSWPSNCDQHGALRQCFQIMWDFPFESQELPFVDIEQSASRADENVASDHLYGDRSRRFVLGNVGTRTEANEQNAKVGVLY